MRVEAIVEYGIANTVSFGGVGEYKVDHAACRTMIPLPLQLRTHPTIALEWFQLVRHTYASNMLQGSSPNRASK